jgi:hypothetical protein
MYLTLSASRIECIDQQQNAERKSRASRCMSLLYAGRMDWLRFPL